MAYAFGLLFVVQAILFIVEGMVGGRLTFLAARQRADFDRVHPPC
jgi:hypothetical protein